MTSREYDNATSLYVSYDGMLEPLGQSQVLCYLERLAEDREIHLVSFEKAHDWEHHEEREAIRGRISKAGIHWHPLRYHKKPSALATSYDIVAGICMGLVLTQKHDIRIVHARSYVPSVMALALKGMTGTRYIFDMRGFWADERVDGGLWPRAGRLYRVAKWFERHFLQQADHVVSLTHAGIREMRAFDYLRDRFPPMTVIPTCADLARFRPSPDASEGFVLGYVGSAGVWYLFDAAVAAFAELRKLRPDARFLIVNRGGHDYIKKRLTAGGVPLDTVELRSATHDDMPAQLARMDASVFFIKPVFSKQASAPTKLAELLGCGIPCLANTGVGDMADVLRGSNVGVAVDALDEHGLRRGVEELLKLVADADVGRRCVETAHRYFSLEEGVRRYQEIYASLQVVDQRGRMNAERSAT